MALDDLLALLPDTPPGNISAADLRTIVTDLYEVAHAFTERWAYEYTSDITPPATGKLNVVWALGPQTLRLSETASDGSLTPFRDSTGARIIINAPGHVLRADINGAPTDQGNYREFPVVVTDLMGGTPDNNSPMNLYTITEVP